MVILIWYLWHIVVDIVDIYEVIQSGGERFVEKVRAHYALSLTLCT